MFTAYYSKHLILIDDLCLIVKNYILTWFLIDLLTTFPFDLLPQFQSDFTLTFKLIRILKVMKIFRLIKIADNLKGNKQFKAIQQSVNLRKQSQEFIFFLIIILFIVHITGCFWYFISKNDQFGWQQEYQLHNYNIINWYCLSFYWAISTICTVGFGDVVAKTLTEKIFNIIWIAIGVGFYSYTIGTIASMMKQNSKKKLSLAYRFFYLQQIAKKKNLNNQILEKITLNLEIQKNQSAKWQPQKVKELFQDIPQTLQLQIGQEINQNFIKSIWFFKNTDSNFVSQIIPYLRVRIFQPQEIIYNKNDYSDFIYIIEKGKVQLYHELWDFKTFTQGSIFGEIEIFKNKNREFMCKAKRKTKILFVLKKYFFQVLQKFPILYQKTLKTAILKDIEIKKNLKNSFQFVEQKQHKKLTLIEQHNLKNIMQKRSLIICNLKQKIFQYSLLKSNLNEKQKLKKKEIEQMKIFQKQLSEKFNQQNKQQKKYLYDFMKTNQQISKNCIDLKKSIMKILVNLMNTSFYLDRQKILNKRDVDCQTDQVFCNQPKNQPSIIDKNNSKYSDEDTYTDKFSVDKSQNDFTYEKVNIKRYDIFKLKKNKQISKIQ